MEQYALGSIAAHVPQDLVQAINRCLQKDPATRWSDAKSLREALVPSDEESEGTHLERILRISTAVILLSLLALGYSVIFLALYPDVTFKGALVGIPLGMASMVLVGVAAAIRLRTQGIDAASIVRKALQQPHWSRSWYPRSLRRRGDLWDRLPRELRRYRTWKGLFLMYVWAVFMPVQILSPTKYDVPTLRRALILITFGALAVNWVLARRATKYIRAALAMSAADASKILNTPTWRASVWRRAPTASLLGAAVPPPSSVESESAAAETRAPTMTPERWEQLSRIVDAAAARPADERAAFLVDACAGDETLRREIQSLLALAASAEGFLATPAVRRSSQS